MNAFGYARTALFGGAILIGAGLLNGCAPTVEGVSASPKDVPLEIIAAASPQNDEIPGGFAAIGCFPSEGPVDGLRYIVSYGDGATSRDPGFSTHRYEKEGRYVVSCDTVGPDAVGSTSIVVTIR